MYKVVGGSKRSLVPKLVLPPKHEALAVDKKVTIILTTHNRPTQNKSSHIILVQGDPKQVTIVIFI